MHHLPAWVALKWINIHKCLSLTLDIEKYICVTTLNFECFNTSMNVLIFPSKFYKIRYYSYFTDGFFLYTKINSIDYNKTKKCHKQ